jgi:quinol monooxygenase YgiN
MIRHTVAFRLRHAAGSAEEAAFLADALRLNEIPGVQNFERLKQVSDKSEFAFGFSMEFSDRAAYDVYNNHPVHTAFVAERWAREVEAAQETDYQPL